MQELTEQELDLLFLELSHLNEQLQQTLEQASESSQVVNLDQQGLSSR